MCRHLLVLLPLVKRRCCTGYSAARERRIMLPCSSLDTSPSDAQIRVCSRIGQKSPVSIPTFCGSRALSVKAFVSFLGRACAPARAEARERRGIQLAHAKKLHASCTSTSQCLRTCLIEAESLILHVNPRIRARVEPWRNLRDVPMPPLIFRPCVGHSRPGYLYWFRRALESWDVHPT